MKTENTIIGCSSYNTPDWKGIFYPEDLPKTKWFDYYCRHFSTYELNATFYRFPTLKSLQSWYDKSPEGFIFSIKAPKLITHTNKFAACEQLLEDFYTVSREALKEKLGCVLFQLPPSFGYTPERLDLLLGSMKPGFRNVIEFRNESWWDKDVFEAFSKKGTTFCSVNYPKLPTAIIDTADTIYVRFHGSPKLFYSSYSREELQRTCEELLQKKKHKEIFIYFNNTAGPAGILNALEMKSLL